MGASVALAGLTGCVKQPLEPIVPYVRQPDNILLGKPMFYATAMTLGGYGRPLLVRNNEGRPSKIEGNPEHPASMGGSDVFSQASVLDLYDPDRLETMIFEGEIKTWPGFLGGVRGQIAAQQAVQGAGLRILTQTVGSPTLAAQIRSVLQKFPGAKWYQWDPVNQSNVYAGAQMAFGQPVETQYRLTEADVIVSLDANFLSSEFPGFTSTRVNSRAGDVRRAIRQRGLSRQLVTHRCPTGRSIDSTQSRAPRRIQEQKRTTASESSSST
jgi:molybdopterin-containing oxidoreductase family iron-sulfur binding subunit